MPALQVLPPLHAVPLLSGVPELHSPVLQTPSPVHSCLSSHAVPVSTVESQPVWGSQKSCVHGFLSSQVMGLPAHAPAVHTSLKVHTLPSSHGLVSANLMWLQNALCLSQVSVVHGLLSSQVVAAPGRQTLPWHRSPSVQALPSLQLAPLASRCLQPLVGSQLSMVQAFLSSQSMLVPTQLPVLHASLAVHALPSLQAKLSSFAVVQPLARSQPSLVQPLPSSQALVVGPVQTEAAHTSPKLHALPSSHAKVLARWAQPVFLSQLSVVHTLLSSQLLAAPTHLLLLHASPLVHASPSLHGVVSAVCWQPSLGSQVSAVQPLPSSHFLPTPRCWQPWAPPHLSSVQASLSSQSTVSSVLPSQSSSLPLQVSSAGMGALQPCKPSLLHIRAPLQMPITAPLSSFALVKQVVLSPSSCASFEHTHLLSVGMQWLLGALLSAMAVEAHR